MRQYFFRLTILFSILLNTACSSISSFETPPDAPIDLLAEAEKNLQRFVRQCTTETCGFRFDPGSDVDTVIVDISQRSVTVGFNDAFAQIPFREAGVRALRERITKELGSDFAGFSLELTALGMPVEQLIPNYYRPGLIRVDERRRPQAPRALQSHVRNIDWPVSPSQGLLGRHIAIWPSHGWYYETALDRWEWQRPRLFQTVEDLLPMSFIVPYLEPMLRRAGASVFLPRERDVQQNEVIVDNDETPDTSRSRFSEHTPTDTRWFSGINPGFGAGNGLLYGATNPFVEGTYRITQTDIETTTYSEWIPDIPERGDYAVYISYARLDGAASDARYTVHHKGGATTFIVDQTMGGGTWTYLDTFRFDEGVHAIGGRVTLENASAAAGRTLSADAVRFGGGMGNIVRGRRASLRPRFTEGARYYMQFAGMPDTLVYNVTETLNDYVDDYRGRAEWVNYLRGAPFGPNKDRTLEGLGIPIDLSLAFHTDAGVTKSDSTIGTLMIYSSDGADSTKYFPDGMSRFANRDLGDIMQTQIVDDLRALYDSNWRRRSIWDRDYSEAVRPNVPGVLLELLSHQNFADMKFALDPRFRFDVGRSVYKSILRYLSSQNSESYVVQPLPVSHTVAEIIESDGVRLSWIPRVDRLESTADATGYVVYMRRGDTAFDNGTPVTQPEFEMTNLDRGVVYSFRISAVNSGGESFPSDVVSIGLAGDELAGDGRPPVLIINGFDRVSGPGTIEQGMWRGFSGIVDEGVPDGKDASYVGEQYDFDMESPWIDDEAPGHGASHSSFETEIRIGNTFDYAAIHGQALLASNRSFVTAANEAVAERYVDLSQFELIDIILGEQKTVIGPGNKKAASFRTFPFRLQVVLRTFAENGGKLFVSGAYVGTDLNGPLSREDDRLFSTEVLQMKWRTDHASQSGRVIAPNDVLMPFGSALTYNTDPTATIYRVESPDAIEPAGEDGEILLRYGDNNSSAAFGVRGDHSVVVFGFPFETILSQANRALLMKAVLNYLEN